MNIVDSSRTNGTVIILDPPVEEGMISHSIPEPTYSPFHSLVNRSKIAECRYFPNAFVEGARGARYGWSVGLGERKLICL